MKKVKIEELLSGKVKIELPDAEVYKKVKQRWDNAAKPLLFQRARVRCERAEELFGYHLPAYLQKASAIKRVRVHSPS